MNLVWVLEAGTHGYVGTRQQLRAFQGLAAQRFAGFAMSGFFIGQRPLGLLPLLAYPVVLLCCCAVVLLLSI